MLLILKRHGQLNRPVSKDSRKKHTFSNIKVLGEHIMNPKEIAKHFNNFFNVTGPSTAEAGTGAALEYQYQSFYIVPSDSVQVMTE